MRRPLNAVRRDRVLASWIQSISREYESSEIEGSMHRVISSRISSRSKHIKFCITSNRYYSTPPCSYGTQSLR